MTVPSTVSRVSYGGDGASVAFPISFYFLANSDIVCLLVDADGNSTTQILNTHYTLTGAGVASGGTLTMLTAPPTGYTLIIYRDPALTQLTDYEPNDPFPAETHERALDRLTMIAQRLKDMFTRTVQLPESDISGVSVSIPSPVAGRGLKWNSAGDALVNSSNDPDAVAATASGYADNAAASAVTASGYATDAAVSAANSAASYDAFDDRYLGSKSADPTLDNDGNALLTGALYWNTVSNKLRIYNGTAWADTATASPASFTPNTFSGNASTTAFTLSSTPASTASLLVFISGVAQRPTTDYTISGTTLTFTSAPPAGTNNIFVLVASTVAVGVPNDGSVTPAKLDRAYAELAAAQSFTKAQRGAIVPLTDGATITPDFALANNYSITLGGNRVLANPTNITAGQSGVIAITQDGTGSRTLAFGSYFKFASGTAPTLTTTAGAVDLIAYFVDSTTRISARFIGDVK